MESVLLVAPITALEFVGECLLAGEGPDLSIYTLQADGSPRSRIRQTVLDGYTIHGIKPAPSQLRPAPSQLRAGDSLGPAPSPLWPAPSQLRAGDSLGPAPSPLRPAPSQLRAGDSLGSAPSQLRAGDALLPAPSQLRAGDSFGSVPSQLRPGDSLLPAPSPLWAGDTLRLCVFGSKALSVLEFSEADQRVVLTRVGCPRRLHDWIWDAQWLGDTLALALGHNSVSLYDYRNGRILKEVHCAEKCILYSAHFVGHTWAELTLISGTVFNQLVIWGVDEPVDVEGRVAPRQRVGGHQGVIFSICYDERNGLLASASDDRSLRVWQVEHLADSECDVRCLLVLYGHQARVWCVRLLPENVVSIGEDSSCIVWNFAGDIVHNFKGHKGRGVRAVAVQEQRGWVATGGADSGIRLWQVEGRSPSSNGLVNLRFNSPECVEAPKAIAMIDTKRLLAMTDAGSVYMNDLDTKEWTFVLADENYRSYSLLDVVKSASNVLCAIGNIAGAVKIFSLPHDGDCSEVKLYEGKVHSLTWVRSPRSDRCHLFTSGPDGVLVWLEVECHSGRVESILEKCRFHLPACKQRWHTSVVFVPSESAIVCGDRRGSLMVFSSNVSSNDLPPLADSSVDPVTQEQSSASNPPDPVDPVFLLYGVHGKLGVTSVTYHDGFVYSTGRDGLYRQLRVEGSQLTVLRKVRSCKGMEWIERLSFPPDGGLQILGFHSTDFVVWSTETSEKVRCVLCGGGHRSWSFVQEGPRDVFAYIKSGEIFAHKSRPAGSSQRVLKDSLHGREVTCVKYAGKVRHGEELLHILITGSEDTTVGIFAFNEATKTIRQLATIGDHLSSVRTLALAKTESEPSDNGVLSCVLFTAGGRAQIECYRLLVRAPEDGGRVTCQVIHLASHRLDEHWDRMKNKHRMIKVDPETRYMSIRAFDDIGRTSSCLCLAAACSDGSVRFFAMFEDLRRMILVAETSYHQRCVLKVETFVHRSLDADRYWLCSAATDGRIALWDVTDAVECAHRMQDDESADGGPRDLGSPCLTLSAHQCGINSLHIRRTREGAYLLASGGDDNSIHVCKLEPDDESKVGIRPIQSASVCSAHAAHVTGLRLLQDDLLASASVDQRLTLWRLRTDGPQHLATKFCHVADVSELECWRSEDDGHMWSALCGQGLEIVVYKHSA